MLDRFAEVLLRDGTAQAELADTPNRESFAAKAAALAATLGFTVSAEMLHDRLQPDPVGLSRFETSPPNCPDRPQTGWLPIGLCQFPPEICVEWGWFGVRAPDSPFYEDALRLARSHPLTRLIRPRTGLARFLAMATEPPDAFIFHMSRCGSTLVHRMFAASPKVLSLSEPNPLDALLEACAEWPEEVQIAALKAMVAALGKDRDGRRLVIKLDSWHVLAWQLFRRAFPNCRAIFLFRAPRAVLSSQLQERGLQTVPQPRFAALYGVKDWQNVPSDEFCARGLAAVCRAGLEACREGAMQAVDYDELPDAATGRIADHLRLGLDCVERQCMRSVAGQDSKAPYQSFVPRQEPRGEALRNRIELLADTHLDEIYQALRRQAFSSRV